MMKGFEEKTDSPVQYVIVAERTKVDLGRFQNIHILRVHSILDALIRPRSASICDGGLEIDEAEVRQLDRALANQVAPNVVYASLLWEGSVQILCYLDIATRVLHITLMRIHEN